MAAQWRQELARNCINLFWSQQIPNVGLMFGQGLRRWPNINPALGQCVLYRTLTVVTQCPDDQGSLYGAKILTGGHPTSKARCPQFPAGCHIKSDSIWRAEFPKQLFIYRGASRPAIFRGITSGGTDGWPCFPDSFPGRRAMGARHI